MPVLNFLKGGRTGGRVDLRDYLQSVTPLLETADREYASWLEAAAGATRTLSRERDPDGTHASVYLWRVDDTAREFVQHEPVKAAARYYEAMALCLENRAAAAVLFKEGTGTASQNKPEAKFRAANKKLVEAERYLARAGEARRAFEGRA